MDEPNDLKGRANRRSFMKKGVAAVGAAGAAGGLLASGLSILGQAGSHSASPSLTPGDAAILRFVAAAEIIESDLWQQYAELGGLTTGTQNPYQIAFQRLDSDGSQYISSNTLDEMSHAKFLNAYLRLKGATPVNFDKFRTLPSSQAHGAKQIGRLTNLMQLTVDTSWYVRYRSKTNPDFGVTYPQAVTIVDKPAIPITNADFGPPDHIQVIADTAAFHFGTIEQGGSSLYSAMAQKARDVEVLRIVVSIGGDEVAHFLEWVDFAGNGASAPLAPITDPITGLSIPNLNASGSPLTQTNLIFPVPCEFIESSLPLCAVIRPTAPEGIAAGVVQFLTDMGLFIGQSAEFLDELNALASAADSAERGF
jgi:hypothetical protein